MNNGHRVDQEMVGEMAGLMRLLGDPTRIRIIRLLESGEMNVTALCGRLDLAQPTVSHHLGLLRTSRLLQTRRDGKQVYYSLNPDHLNTMPGDGGLLLSFGRIRLQFGAPGAASPESTGPARDAGRRSSRRRCNPRAIAPPR